MAINENAIYTARRIIEAGWAPIHSFATVGNDYQESLLKPSIVGDKMLKNAAHGIGQWRGPRFDQLQEFAAKAGKPWTDLDVQIDFQLAEMAGLIGDGYEGAHGKRLKATTDLESAVAAAIGLFRPKGWSLKNPKAGHGWKNRLQNARDLQDYFVKQGAASIIPKNAPAETVKISEGDTVTIDPGFHKPVIVVAAPRAKATADRIAILIPPMIQQGDKGPAVEALQSALIAEGYKIAWDGDFGPGTNTAVRHYQESRGLSVDGQVGAETVKALVARKAPLPAAVPATDKPLWLLAALADLGTKERAGAGNNPVLLDWAKKEGGSIAKVYTADSIPWCALGANHWLTKANLPGTETLWALDFDPAIGKGWPCVKLAGPAVGAFMPMRRDGGGHIAVCAGRTKDGYLAGVGANQSDAVTIASFPKTRPTGFFWPLRAPAPKLVGFNYLPIVDSSGRSIQEA